MPAFTNILIRQGVISKEQLAHAEEVAREQALGVGDALHSLGYATGEQVMRAVAEEQRVFRRLERGFELAARLGRAFVRRLVA